MAADLFFDLDRTLWDFDRNSRDALEEIYLEIIVPAWSEAPDVESFIAVYEKENEKCWRAYREGKLSQSELRPIRFQRTMEALQGGRIKGLDSLSEAMGEAYVQRAPYRTRLIDGALEVSRELFHRGHRMFILTNGFDEVQHIKMNNSGLNPFYESVFTSDALGYKKPKREVFDACLEQTGSSAQRAIMIGDDLECDVVGARNAGWRQVYFNPKAQGHKEQIWRTVTHLRDLLKLPFDL